MLRELREDDLTGYDRLQHLLTIAFVDNFLGQVRLSQGATTLRRGCSPTAWPWPDERRTDSYPHLAI